jgi:hypothetical protein
MVVHGTAASFAHRKMSECVPSLVRSCPNESRRVGRQSNLSRHVPRLGTVSAGDCAVWRAVTVQLSFGNSRIKLLARF